MKKNFTRSAICLGVLLLLYILLAFLIPFPKTAVFWLSFGFTLVAFAVTGWALYTAFLKNPGATSRFYGFPIARIGVIYGGGQLVCGLLFMALGKWIPTWLAVLVYAAMLGAAVIGLMGAETVVDTIQNQDQKLKQDVRFMRELQSKVNQMATQCSLPEVKQFCENIRYSDPVSSEALAEIDLDLSAAVDNLQSAIVDGDNIAIRQLAQKADNVLSERNRLCKLNKS
mgnify:FL=1